MKKHLLLLAAILLATGAYAQKNIAAPAAAKAAFQKAYPTATRVKWGKEDADYEVNFTLASKEMSAVYDAAGALKETEEDIQLSELPAGITGYIKQHYQGAAIKEAARITKAGGEVNYEAEVNKTDVLFDKHGKFLKEVKD
jgi:autotransporter translocation and assembly factor TamB